MKGKATVHLLVGLAVVLPFVTLTGCAGRQSAGSDGNLKRLALALNMYANDWGDKLPPMRDAAVLKSILMPYVKDAGAFANPATGQPYEMNSALSGRTPIDVATAPAFWEATPSGDGTRGVALVSGTVQRVKESDWQQIKSASGIP